MLTETNKKVSRDKKLAMHRLPLLLLLCVGVPAANPASIGLNGALSLTARSNPRACAPVGNLKWCSMVNYTSVATANATEVQLLDDSAKEMYDTMNKVGRDRCSRGDACGTGGPGTALPCFTWCVCFCLTEGMPPSKRLAIVGKAANCSRTAPPHYPRPHHRHANTRCTIHHR